MLLRSGFLGMDSCHSLLGCHQARSQSLKLCQAFVSYIRCQCLDRVPHECYSPFSGK